MTITKSYTDTDRFGAIYRTSLRQHIPIAIVVCIVFSLLILLPFAYETLDPSTSTESQVQWLQKYMQGVYIDGDNSFFINVVMVFSGAVCALVASGYMHHKRKVDFFHSLPVSRRDLLSAHMLASFTAVIGAFLAVCLMTMACQIPYYIYHTILDKYYFIDFLGDVLVQSICFSMVYLFTIFVSVHVGTTFDAIAATLALGFAPLVLVLACNAVWSDAIYGASFDPDDYALLLSPFTFIFHRGDYQYRDAATGRYLVNYGELLPFLGISVIIGALLYAGAIHFYNRRSSELAEQTPQSGGVLLAVKAFATFCGSILFYYIFESKSLLAQLIGMMIGALAIGVVVELVLSRNFRNIRKSIRWIAGFGAVYCLLLFVVQNDLAGYQTRIPRTSAVSQVRVNYQGRIYDLNDLSPPYGSANSIRTVTLTEPESIEIVKEAQRTGIDQYLSGNRDRNSFQVEYQLKAGGTLRRSYSKFSNEAYSLLARLEGQNDYITQRLLLFQNQNVEISQTELIQRIYFEDNLGLHNSKLSLTDMELASLLDALRADVLDETFEDIVNASRPAYGFLTFFYEYPADIRLSSDTTTISETIMVSTDYRRTISLLRGWDVGDTDEALIGQLTSACVIGFDNDWRRGYRVLINTPDLSGHINSYKYSAKSATEDPVEIALLYHSSVNQIYASASLHQSDMEYRMVCFLVNGKIQTIRFIHLNDLPNNLRNSSS